MAEVEAVQSQLEEAHEDADAEQHEEEEETSYVELLRNISVGEGLQHQALEDERKRITEEADAEAERAESVPKLKLPVLQLAPREPIPPTMKKHEGFGVQPLEKVAMKPVNNAREGVTTSRRASPRPKNPSPRSAQPLSLHYLMQSARRASQPSPRLQGDPWSGLTTLTFNPSRIPTAEVFGRSLVLAARRPSTTNDWVQLFRTAPHKEHPLNSQPNSLLLPVPPPESSSKYVFSHSPRMQKLRHVPDKRTFFADMMSTKIQIGDRRHWTGRAI
jgi:hypothetical protein